MNDRARRILATLTLTFAVVARPALAEDAPPPRPWNGSAELSYVGTSGNTDTQSLGAGAELHYKPGIWAFEFKANYVSAETDGVTSAEKTAVLIGASRAITPRLDYYARVGYLADEFSGIDSNLSGDTGVSYRVLTGERHFLDAGGGVGYTSEQRVVGADREFATGSAFAKYRFAISKSAELANNATYLYDFEDSDNWRFLNSLSVSAAINSLFSLKAYYNVIHLNDPVPGFEKTDSTTGVSLVAKF